MHLLLTIISIIAACKWGDWKHWQKYQPTMLFVAASNLLYNFVYMDHLLWELQAIISGSHTIGEIFYTLVVFPLTALIFLTHYPDTTKGRIFRNIKFIAIYIIVEVILDRYGEIVYGYGWNIWWSLAWDCMMFPIWALHYKKPLIAYGVSFVVVVIVLLLFPVSLS